MANEPIEHEQVIEETMGRLDEMLGDMPSYQANRPEKRRDLAWALAAIQQAGFRVVRSPKVAETPTREPVGGRIPWTNPTGYDASDFS